MKHTRLLDDCSHRRENRRQHHHAGTIHPISRQAIDQTSAADLQKTPIGLLFIYSMMQMMIAQLQAIKARVRYQSK
jgi:hypothetical protein